MIRRQIKCENISDSITKKSNHKYIYRKTLINTKFEWFNNYLKQKLNHKDEKLTHSMTTSKSIFQIKNIKDY
jgi:hypothetical protein